jgi:hypothetical protein
MMIPDCEWFGKSENRLDMRKLRKKTARVLNMLRSGVMIRRKRLVRRNGKMPNKPMEEVTQPVGKPGKMAVVTPPIGEPARMVEVTTEIGKAEDQKALDEDDASE